MKLEETKANVVNSQVAEKSIYAVPQWKLIWWRFREHRLAMAAGAILIILYFLALFAPFFSPHNPYARNSAYKHAPPTKIHIGGEDGLGLRPYVYPLKSEMDMTTFERVYKPDESKPTPLYFLVRGFEYKVLGVFTSDLHLFGTGDPNVPVNIFGTDELGRDLFSRVLYGARISLSIGLLGVAISFFIGVLLGGLAGYFGGRIDMTIQRIIEIVRSIPQLPLWMGLSAALPAEWSAIQVYMAITVILSLLGWTDLARVVRGRFLSLREEDFVVAARLMGRGHLEIIFIHMLPSFMSHIIASLTLAIPVMILGETSLSFLGIGLQPPTVSWGVLLKQAQSLQTIVTAPWLMIPGIFVIITVLAFNFLGDGLRDAADPYAQ